MRNARNVAIASHNNILLQLLSMHTNSSFIRVSPLLLKWVRSSIFVHYVVQTAEYFPDKLPIFTRRQHHIITTLWTDFPLILIILCCIFESLRISFRRMKLRPSCTLKFLGIWASQNISEYYDVCVFDRTNIRNQTSFECYKWENANVFKGHFIAIAVCISGLTLGKPCLTSLKTPVLPRFFAVKNTALKNSTRWCLNGLLFPLFQSQSKINQLQ